MDISNFYYTYSTISQTLATTYGLLLAAYTFRVVSADADLNRRLERYKMAVSQEPMAFDALENIAHEGQKDLRDVQRLAMDMRAVTWWTIGTIAACLILMPVTVDGLLVSFRAISWLSLIATVALALTCLVLYCRIIMRVIPKPN